MLERLGSKMAVLMVVGTAERLVQQKAGLKAFEKVERLGQRRDWNLVVE